MALAPWFQMPKCTTRPKNVAVIGGGIAGNTLAHRLNSKGIDVTIFDKRAGLAEGASGNPAAIFEPKLMRGETPLGQYLTSSYLYALQFYKALETKTGEDIWHHRGGTLNLIADEKDLKRHQSFPDNAELAREHYAIVNPVQASELAGIPISQSAMWYPRGGCINTSSLARALTKGLKVSLDCEIASITKQNQSPTPQWRLNFKGGQKSLDFDVVIMANAFAARKFEQSQLLPIVMNRGQVSTSPRVSLSDNLKCVVSGAGYLTPLIEEKHVFGATFERLYSFDEAEDCSVVNERHEHNLSFLKESLPSFAEDILLSDLKGRTSVRGTTFDRLPLVGPLFNHEDYIQNYGLLKYGAKHRDWTGATYHEGLYISAGFGSRGFVTAPLMASYLTALITGEETPIPDQLISSIHPARFAIRDLKRGIIPTSVDP